MMQIKFTKKGWEDYIFWEENDRKIIKKINLLLKDIMANGPAFGIGKPEPLAGELEGFFSRRINDKDRLIYTIDKGDIVVLSCRYHYSDK